MTDMDGYNHLIKLKPLDYFFFGGETTFGNGEGQNYYAKSNPFPQQTSVLGLLRYLGYQNGLPIGESFDAEGPEEQDFGFIERLSPVFLVKEKEDGTEGRFLPGPLVPAGDQSVFQPEMIGEGTAYWNNGWQPAYISPGYEAKKGWDQLLVGSGSAKHSFDEVFKPLTKIGITKARRTDAFYKQQVFSLEKGWCFAVLAQLSETDPLPESQIAPFGAEKALFSVRLEKGNSNFDQFFPKAIWKSELNFPCVALVSDAFVPEEIYAHCRFAVTHLRDFRNIRTPQAVYTSKRFGPLRQTRNGGAPDTLYKSGKYNLLARGSLLWPQDMEAVTELLEKNPYTQIGYNKFVIIP